MVGQPTTEAMSREGKGTQAETPAGRSQPLDWAEAERRLRKGGWFWLATVRPDAAPHVMPVFAAWSAPMLYVASKATARKTRNLDANARCVVTTDTGDLHLIVEGEARHVHDAETLQRASDAFATIYEWPTTVSEGKLDAEFGAPTSGGPPYDVFEIRPTRAFALPTDGESMTPTRWRFDR
jgi:nitroimidazol reductase NimA-like FMN-containing flavoprotein (pyridoxamine 5'-phosphate oxidase superfamily)